MNVTPAELPARDAGVASSTSGIEWVIDASGCDPERLRDLAALEALVAAIVHALALHPVAPATWHRFPSPGGITGALVLAESHLTVHTFPEHGTLCLNLFCCRPRAEWCIEELLGTAVGARACTVRRLVRQYGASPR